MANIVAVKTSAETALDEAFGGLREALPGVAAVRGLRDGAIARFRESGLPHRRVEEWKYTDLRNLMRDANPVATGPQGTPAAAGKAEDFLAGLDHIRLVVVDGAYSPALSNIAALPAGLKVTSLAEALASTDDALIADLSAGAPDNAVLDLNTAFMSDGVVVSVDAGVEIGLPVAIETRHTGTVAQATFTRSLVVLGAGAKLTLIDSYEGPEGVAHQTNAALAVKVGDGAELQRISFQVQGLEAQHISTVLASLGKESVLQSFALEAGAAVARNQLFVTYRGDDAKIVLSGATLLAGKRHADTTLVVDHMALGGESRELFHAVIDDEARSVFQGKIVVRQGAQKTDGRMMSRSLLLSETAEANAKPELEIFADDVVCAHGATCGALDEDLLFYCKARGIPQKEAEAILVQAFIGEAIETVENEELRERLNALTEAWLDKRA
ncbi:MULTISPECIES: Fe-S cluster assembly protein SufD [Labrys]|uniref:Fe-S cluster assembly protein SufD n=1 Tax=Labrys TaxID=204476 RepID=UPI0008321DC8|nr:MULTISPECIES: Fe-S cluster assembly protein SufD [unclassified Labrys (in: a-proteobacteria)]MDZ5448483.1 Fe-S cluster assembly protein SufD [Labrys sp. ZIDIC5]OCC06292.1 Fe-S cluster assembly protein SufD [Labrys sp. WJW]